MQQVTVLHNQSLLDIAVQEYGNAKAVFELALANGIAVTDRLEAGQFLTLPIDAPADRDIVRYYQGRKLRPATGTPLIAEKDLEDWFGSLPGMLPLLLS